MRARKDIAVSHPVLERDLPAPSRRHRCRDRVGADIVLRVAARHRRGAVARQPVGPVFPRRAHFGAEQQRTKAGAVDEQIAFDPPPVLQLKRAHIAGRAVALHGSHQAFVPHNPVRDAEVAHEGAEKRCVELVGIAIARRERPIGRRRGDAVGARGCHRQRVITDIACPAPTLHLQPPVMEGDTGNWLPETAERVDVAFTDAAEIAEIDAQLVRGVGRLHEGRLVDAQSLHESTQVRQGRLADPDDADVLAFDQLDARQSRQHPRNPRRGHPAGGPPAQHDDADRLPLSHARFPSRSWLDPLRAQEKLSPACFRARCLWSHAPSATRR